MARNARSPIGRFFDQFSPEFEAQIANRKEIAMTITYNTRDPLTTSSEIRRKVGRLISRFGRLINHVMAAALAHRARQADIAILCQLTDRELKDIGLTRGEIGEGLAQAAISRIRMQRIEHLERPS